MQCPSCPNTDSRVLESRSADAVKSVRRRRECLNCDVRFTTYERVETVPISVLKRNGSREKLRRVKVLRGMNRACEKTTLRAEEIELIVDGLELQLQQRNVREINSSALGEMVLDQLRGVNEVAYVRFASVYRQFHGINDFVAALESIKAGKGELATVV